MKKNIRVWIYSVVVIGAFLMLTTNCNKDDDNNNPSSSGTVKDIDGNVYNTVTIGPQVWMVENLKTTKYRNGDPIPIVTDDIAWGNLTTGAQCNYNNDAATGNKYGKFYNWHAVNDSRNLAPAGWHVATAEEFDELTIYLGGGAVAGGKMKEIGTSHWAAPNAGATNESSFTALPVGFRANDGTSTYDRSVGIWWSSTEYIANNVFYYEMNCNDSYIRKVSSLKECGFSVRCVRDKVD